MSARPDLMFGVLAVELGFISSDQLREVLKVQQLFPDPSMRPLVGQLLVDRKLISPTQVVKVLQAQRKRREIPTPDVSPVRVSLNLAPGALFGRWLVVREMGEGTLGVVFEARAGGGEPRAALKILRPALGGPGRIPDVRHPAVARRIEAGEIDGLSYVASEWIEGEHLGRALEREGTTPRQAVGWVVQAARGLQAIHEAGGVHGAVRTHNILIDATGRARLTDAGMDAFAGEESARVPAYTAPEHLHGGSSASGDLFALGVVLYEAIVGVPPFLGDTVAELCERITSAEPQRPRALNPQIDPALETVCLAALRKVPKDRYASAADLADDLERWDRGQPVRPPETSGIFRLLKRLRNP